MKLSRTEKLTENSKLDQFLKFLPEYIENLKSGLQRDLTLSERESFRCAYEFLERDFGNRQEKGRKQTTTDVARAQVIAELNGNRITVKQALEQLNISSATLYRYWNKKNTAELKTKKPAESKNPAKSKFLVLHKISENTTTEPILPKDLKLLSEALKVISDHRKLAKVRAKNLGEGREKLEEVYSTVKNKIKAVEKIRQEKN